MVISRKVYLLQLPPAQLQLLGDQINTHVGQPYTKEMNHKDYCLTNLRKSVSVLPTWIIYSYSKAVHAYTAVNQTAPITCTHNISLNSRCNSIIVAALETIQHVVKGRHVGIVHVHM